MLVLAYSPSNTLYIENEDIATYSDQFLEQSIDWKTWVLNRVEEAGFSPKTANRVINCESGWKTDSHNWNDPFGGSHGIWQLNGVHGLSMEDMLDPYKSTEKAIELLKSTRSWNHWSCY